MWDFCVALFRNSRNKHQLINIIFLVWEGQSKTKYFNPIGIFLVGFLPPILSVLGIVRIYVKLLLYHYYKIHQHMLIWLLLQYAHCCNNINQLFYKIIYIYKTFNNVYTTDLSLQQFFYHCEEGVLKFLWYAKMRRLFAPSLSQHTVKIVHNI